MLSTVESSAQDVRRMNLAEDLEEDDRGDRGCGIRFVYS